MSAVAEAVVLMAGAGSRLRIAGHKLPKPLVPLLGRPLISYTFETLVRAGIKTVYAVVGFESGILVPEVEQMVPRGLAVRFIENPDWKKQNGISVLAAAPHVSSPFLLTMADHLFDQAIVDLVLHAPVDDELNLAIDRKLDSICDIDDAMKVRTRADRVVAIGKDLTDYDAIDTGIFLCSETIFDYLEAAKSRSRGSDCSLADGVRAMAAAGKVGAIDIGDVWWQDIDTPEMLAAAEKYLRQGRSVATANIPPGRRDSTKTEAHARDNQPEV
jgi:1L-myo-inositol 1-phosphate cytidylyltransferase